MKNFLFVSATESFDLENFVLSHTILDVVAFTSRIFARENCHLLMIGDPGTGKSEAIHIATNLFNVKYASTALTRNYAMEEFRADLKSVSRSVVECIRPINFCFSFEGDSIGSVGQSTCDASHRTLADSPFARCIGPNRSSSRGQRNVTFVW